jgi:hypothetical protein
MMPRVLLDVACAIRGPPAGGKAFAWADSAFARVDRRGETSVSADDSEEYRSCRFPEAGVDVDRFIRWPGIVYLNR